MSQIQPVPGPSQDAFNAVVEHIATVDRGSIKNSAVSNGDLRLYTKDNLIVIEMSSLTLANSLAANSGVNIGNIPSDYRPSVQQNGYGIGVTGGAVHIIRITVQTNGDVSVTNLGSSGSKLYSDGQFMYLKH